MNDERSLTSKETGGLRNRRGRNIKYTCDARLSRGVSRYAEIGGDSLLYWKKGQVLVNQELLVTADSPPWDLHVILLA